MPTRCELALFGAAIWLFGFELAPMLHLSFHDLLEPHQHGVASHHQHHNGAKAQTDDDEDSLSAESPSEHRESGEAPSEHGEGSLAHRNLAAHASPLSLPPVQQAQLAWSQAEPMPCDEEARPAELRVHSARAPPA